MRTILLNACLLILASTALAGDSKPYTEWTAADAAKLLKKSPWIEEVVWTRLVDERSDERIEDAGGCQTLKIRVMLFSSHPIRQALAVSAAKGEPGPLARWREFATRDYGDEIVVAWLVDADPKGCPILQVFQEQLRNLTTAQLSAETFLATSSGRRAYLKEYVPPTPDGTGAKFVFPRRLPDGTALVTPADTAFSFQATRIPVVSEYELRTRRPGCRMRLPQDTLRESIKDSRSAEANDLQVSVAFRLRKLLVNDRPDY